MSTVKANDDASLKLRRMTDQFGTKLLNIGFALIGLFAIAWLGTTTKLEAITTLSMSATSVVIGIITSLTAMFKPDSRVVNKILLPKASGLLAFGLLLCAYKLAYEAATVSHLEDLVAFLWFNWDYVLWLSFAIAMLLGLVADVNYI